MAAMAELLRTEFHCHTIYSGDSLTKPEALIRTARRKGLHRVIVTDHNSIAGALVAQKIDPDLIIVGEEIRTTRGEILAAYVTEHIPAGLTPEETIRRLRDQGAFISVSHPYDVLRSGHWEEPYLLNITPFVDAIETFNARCMRAEYNRQASDFAREHGLAGTVGSDAHAAFELGRAHLALPPFEGGDGLRLVIRQGQPITRLSSPLVHLTSRYATIAKRFNHALDMQKQS
jgi:predicted metal-dependent phosphoesterase TrpH